MKMSKWWCVLGLGIASVSFADGVQATISPDADLSANTPVVLTGTAVPVSSSYLHLGLTANTAATTRMAPLTVATAEAPSPGGVVTPDTTISGGTSGQGVVDSIANDVEFTPGSCSMASGPITASFSAYADVFPKYRNAYYLINPGAGSCVDFADANQLTFSQEVTISTSGSQSVTFSPPPGMPGVVCVFAQQTSIHNAATLPRSVIAARISWASGSCTITSETAR